MSYFGTMLLTRADGLLTRLPGVEAVGYLHRCLRELGGGWQLLETAGWHDPPDLERAATAAAASWRAPVFVAYVADECAQLHGAAPGEPAWSGHLDDPAETDCGMLHRPATRPGGTFEALQAQLADWAAAAGLSPSVPRLARALRHRLAQSHRSDAPYLSQEAQIYEVVRGLGFPVLPAPRDYTFDPYAEPLLSIIAPYAGAGPGARIQAVWRDHDGDPAAPAGWEEEAIQLEVDIFASLWGGAYSAAELINRAEWVVAARRAAKRKRPLPPRRAAQTPSPEEPPAGRVLNGAPWDDPNGGPGLWPDPI